MPNHIRNRITTDAEIIDRYMQEGQFDFRLAIPQPSELVTEDVDTRVTSVAEIAMGMIEFETQEPSGGREAAFNRGDYGVLADTLHVQNAMRALRDKKMANTFDDSRFEQFINCCRSLRSTGCVSWYEWNTRNWGTKWNAYRTERPVPNIVTFETAWNAPHKVIAKIFADSKFDVFHEWADEDTGSNVGRVYYRNGSEPEIHDLAETKEGYELAFDLHGEQPEYYQFNESLNTYEYVETEEAE